MAGLDAEQRSELLGGLLEELGGEHGELPEAVSDERADPSWRVSRRNLAESVDLVPTSRLRLGRMIRSVSE